MIGPTRFINNKYRRWYFQIVDRARTRILDDSVITEKHHVYPSSFGGTNQCLVSLTLREHFLVHWLLVKFLEGDARRRMYSTLAYFTRHIEIRSSWRYKLARELARISRRGYKCSVETRRLMGENAKKRTGEKNPFFGKKHSEKFKQELSNKMKGEKHPFFGKKRPEHSLKLKGRTRIPFSEEHRLNIKKTWQESRKRVTCEFCGIITTKSMNTRWHGNQCRTKQVIER